MCIASLSCCPAFYRKQVLLSIESKKKKESCPAFYRKQHVFKFYSITYTMDYTHTHTLSVSPPPRASLFSHIRIHVCARDYVCHRMCVCVCVCVCVLTHYTHTHTYVHIMYIYTYIFRHLLRSRTHTHSPSLSFCLQFSIWCARHGPPHPRVTSMSLPQPRVSSTPFPDPSTYLVHGPLNLDPKI